MNVSTFIINYRQSWERLSLATTFIPTSLFLSAVIHLVVSVMGYNSSWFSRQVRGCWVPPSGECVWVKALAHARFKYLCLTFEKIWRKNPNTRISLLSQSQHGKHLKETSVLEGKEAQVLHGRSGKQTSKCLTLRPPCSLLLVLPTFVRSEFLGLVSSGV